MQWQKQCKFSVVADNRQEILHTPQDPQIPKKLLTRKLGTWKTFWSSQPWYGSLRVSHVHSTPTTTPAVWREQVCHNKPALLISMCHAVLTYVRTYLFVVVACPKSKVWKAAHRVHSCEPCAIRREPGVIQTSSTFITLQVKRKQCHHNNSDYV